MNAKVIEFNGRRYTRNERRKMYVSQSGGVLAFLHREMFYARHGKESVQTKYVVPIGAWDDFSAENWKAVTRSEVLRDKPRFSIRKHQVQYFNGVAFYQGTQGYFYSATARGNIAMHRAVWEAAHSKIPQGYHVHHINGNRADNRIENLRLIEGREHGHLHFGTAEMREAVSKRMRAFYTTEKGRATVEQRKATRAAA